VLALTVLDFGPANSCEDLSGWSRSPTTGHVSPLPSRRQELYCLRPRAAFSFPLKWAFPRPWSWGPPHMGAPANSERTVGDRKPVWAALSRKPLRIKEMSQFKLFLGTWWGPLVWVGKALSQAH
jgi:hypothetical protein